MSINKYVSVPIMRTIETGSSTHSPPILTRRRRKKPRLTLPAQTEVKRISQGREITILRIRFGSVDWGDKKSEEKSQVKDNDLDSPKLPFLRSRKKRRSDSELENLGYDPDTRIGTEIYEDKVNEKKKNYLNKMQSLKKQLQKQEIFALKRQQLEKSRIKVKLLAEQLKRKRQRQAIKKQEIKGKKILDSLLRSSHSETTAL